MSSQMYNYSILPCDDQSVIQWAPKFIDFRLNALKTAPKHTTSSYELEATISEQEWISTLTKPLFRVVLCVARGVEGDTAPVWENEWVGILCLYGPRYEYQAAEDCIESTWYLGAGFVSPLHRGHGILVKIFTFGVQQVGHFETRVQSQTQRRVKAARHRTRIQIIAKAGEEATLNYYRTAGLEVTEHLTLGGYSKRGWSLPINADLLGMKIVVMEKFIDQEAVVMARL